MHSGTGKKTALIFLLSLIAASGLFGQSLSLSAELEQEDIWLGDTVQLTLYLQGSEDVISPKLQIPDVRVEALGGTVRSSRSITNINGKVTENIRKAYVYGYNLTPKTAGRIVIPSIEVVVDGVRLSSRELLLEVKQPEQSDDFKLELEFDESRVYLDEECRLRVSFIYGQSLRGLRIMIPGLESLPIEALAANGSGERYEISLNGSSVIFSRDDRAGMSGLSTILKIRPEAAGAIRLQNSTASFESVTGYQRVQDLWGRIQKQEVYGRMVITGNPASIQVLPFPEDGKPNDFFGLSGSITVELRVEPDEVHIGDPMTLNLSIAGMNNTDIRIPRLEAYLGDGIDLPDTRSSARVDGGIKTITQTVRIKDPEVQQIPSIRFSYFNTETEKYEYASSEAVPVRVLDTKIITQSELEGADANDAQEKKVMLEKKREGLYHNYSGSGLLASDKKMTDIMTDSILIKLLLIIPPLVFLIVLIYSWLLPQVKAQAEARADRSRALLRLKKYIRKNKTDDSKLFLKEFNRHLVVFLKVHGLPEDEIRLKDLLDEINSVLYGRMDCSPEEARKFALSSIEILQDKAVRNV